MRIVVLAIALLVPTGAAVAGNRPPVAMGAYASDPAVCADQWDIEHKIILDWVNNGLSIKPIRDSGALCRIEHWKVSGAVFSGKGYCVIKGEGPDDDYAFKFRVIDRRHFESAGKTYSLCPN